MPSNDRAAAAKYFKLSTAKGNSPSRNTATGFPLSRTSSSVSFAESAAIASANLSSAALLTAGVNCDQCL